MRRLLCALLACGLIASACSTSTDETTTSTQPPPTTGPTTTVPRTSTTSTTMRSTIGRATGAFAAFEIEPLLDDSIPYAGPPTPTSLDDVLVAPALYDEVNDPDLLGTLSTNGFVVVPGTTRLFHQAYGYASYDPFPVFVTTDLAYHVWHLAFDKVLRETEQQVLLPLLEEFILDALEAARRQQAELAGTELADDATRVVEWFQAAGALLGLDVGTLGSRAAEELALATAADELTNSPITSYRDCDPALPNPMCIDYTLYRPRGHYTRNDDLERYFRAMSHLGQSAFLVKVPESLRLGLLVSRVVSGDPHLAQRWALIYEPTAFLVGTADDYTPFEAEAAAGGLGDVAALADLDDVGDIGAGLLATRGVAINPEAASIRVMGARFVVDSYILDQLTAPYVSIEDSGDARQVSPLDLAAAFGSDFAYATLDADGRTEPPWLHYDEQLAAMRTLLADRDADAWASTVYDAWLYALEPMWSEHGLAFPDFMQNEAWTAKAHQTGFGSYTELKHDTILYAKQGFAIEGEFEPVFFEPRHWVEPDPVAFHRIEAVAALAREGLEDRGLLDAEAGRLLDEVRDLVSRLAQIAEDELAGRPISEADNAWLEGIGSAVELIWLAASDIDPETGFPDVEDEDSALVADIFRTSFNILELGTGRIDRIYVLVPNDEGVFQIARGGVYSYYEFWRDAAEGRLTDEEWKALLAGGHAPDRPVWQGVFLPGAAGGTAALPEPEETFLGIPPGRFCRDLYPLGYTYADAYAYWEWEGRPDRMDADRNSVPCETVYPADVIERFLAG